MSRIPARKKRRLSPEIQGAEQSSDDEAHAITAHELSRRASHWDLEQDYESRPRKKAAKESKRLPIVANGQVYQANQELEEDSDVSEASIAEEGDIPSSPDNPQPEQPVLSRREQILHAKEEFARIASLINEDPEEHIGGLRTLANLTAGSNATVTKLGLVTQVAVYKDIIPGYRIRPLGEEEPKEKLSKDVRKLRNFEQSIVAGYQKYVQELVRIATLDRKDHSAETAGLVTVAVSCACNLLNAVPHFNFRGDLLKILVAKLSGKATNNFQTCKKSLETLFAEDEDGNASSEAVMLLSKMIKARDYHIESGVLQTFLHLRLLSEFSKKGSATSIDKDEDSESTNLKKSKQKREFWTKKQRKIAKERKVIAKQMKEADAVVSYEDRDQKQAETLKMVFGIYFRILKARRPHLMAAVLEGLARYAHLINQDFFGDILESLKELIQESGRSIVPDSSSQGDDDDEQTDESLEADERNAVRESLLCIVTAFALLEGQDGASAAKTLNLDLKFFISHLYCVLYPTSLTPTIEATGTHGTSTTASLLTQALQSALLPPHALHSTPPIRIAAFVKATLTSSLHFPQRTAIAMMRLLGTVARTHKRKIAGLWNTEERKGDGVYDGATSELEASNPFAGNVWEGELFRLHFSPQVREGYVKGIEDVVKIMENA